MKTKNYFSKITALAAIILLFSFTTRAQVTLYGLTSAGGYMGEGTVFSVTGTGIIDTLCSLNDVYAAVPDGSLLYASDGNFYASSLDGGYGDSCTIFRCSKNGILTTMINLDSVWGSSSPMGNNLIQASDGNLYGMTSQGGINNEGVLYKLTLSGQYSAIHFFDVFAGYPYGSLIQTADGSFWGMTYFGGTEGYGTIFNCKTDGTFIIKYSFKLFDGMFPSGDLFLASDGNFYGLTSQGGANNYGTLFRFTPSGVFTKLVDFDYTNGANPYGSLIQASDGNLYGLTSRGGTLGDSAFGYGTLFMCTLSGNLTTLTVFNDSNGSTPEGTLMEASDGMLYGMTMGGGDYNYGVVFKCPLGGSVNKIADFNYTNGGTPVYGKLIEIGFTQGVKEVSKTNGVKVYPNPSTGVFNIQLANSQQLTANSSVVVYNMLGEQVYSEQLTMNNGQLTIDLSNNANGVYLYKIVSETGSLVSDGKFIIQK